MLAAEKCRDRAAECQRMADHAPNARVRDILLDIGRTWTRLALEVEQWTQINRPSARLTKAAPKNATKGANAADPTSISRFEATAILGKLKAFLTRRKLGNRRLRLGVVRAAEASPPPLLTL